jgi:hypothetical protein
MGRWDDPLPPSASQRWIARNAVVLQVVCACLAVACGDNLRYLRANTTSSSQGSVALTP